MGEEERGNPTTDTNGEEFRAGRRSNSKEECGNSETDIDAATPTESDIPTIPNGAPSQPLQREFLPSIRSLVAVPREIMGYPIWK